MSNKDQHQFTITAYDKLGTLERILRVIRHRGGHIKQMQMQTKDDQILSLSLALTTKRPISALLNQIDKLVDVISIEI
ncbi:MULTISPECIES: acetolactate synthase 2 small subunit [unclassified Gilliamella]|uniref:acetolactate synthase 2 small subunit n=1 Tax=unclassified Gilliamella TaxID=2685620 RepID=UPI001C6A6DF4|nr:MULTISPECIES: acetolactate synthase 2 small subunit [unclassified Gilliamella]MCX8574745.1 acetolactate synthase 2 small subunit [Gilliamella sp. B3831]MCX8576901.1 acetolactate synthase 2 small subunit [Gilliamella sp. B3815]MCX8590469.1 acetolactate synthase 2 small subunit [Gilliamella sp. B3812]MCX8604077.1 acetolactate synthase 2 small subunit [Gilliamella sp. B3823]MCX8605808.1 acetolactate synthase 2 small subunit [Gilliamella sp. B3825]